MKISVFLLSHNKDGWVQEAIQSVTKQEHENWELFVIDNSTDGVTREKLADDPELHGGTIYLYLENLTAEKRASKFVAGYLLNKYYPLATGDIVMFLADDDLFLDPKLFGEISRHFEETPEHRAVYFHMHRAFATAPGEGKLGPFYATIPALSPRGSGLLDCHIDGGQVAIRKDILDELDEKGIPYYHEDPDPQLSSHGDGIHLETIARETGTVFYPLPVDGLIHRTTPDSTWTKL